MKRIIGVAAILAGILHMRWRANATQMLEHSVSVSHAGMKCRLLFISDLHSRRLRKNDIQFFPKPADAVIIGGDMADSETAVSVIRDNLVLLKEIGPIYAVRGNHDFRRLPLLHGFYEKFDVRLLVNEWVQLKNGLILAGSDDELAGKPHKLMSIPMKASGPFIWICHNPRTPLTVRLNRRPDLILSGHTHGGQIRLGPFGLDEVGGMKSRFRTKLLISNGYGTRKIPLRLGAPPHIHSINMINHQ